VLRRGRVGSKLFEDWGEVHLAESLQPIYNLSNSHQRYVERERSEGRRVKVNTFGGFWLFSAHPRLALELEEVADSY
jgi:hypothetical protein